MAIPRFFCATPLIPQIRLELPDPLAHHALRVLRLKPGQEMILFDGQGGQYPATLSVEGKRGYANLGEHQAIEAELPGVLTLVQGIPSGDKMDWVIEKAVELGAARLVPIAAQRSVLQLSGDRLVKRLAHWRRIATAASEQCGRNRILQIDPPCSLQDFLVSDKVQSESTLFCHPGSALSLAQAVHAAPDALNLLVGPEGGWSDEEQATVLAHRLTPVRFGQRVLRTETAGLAMLAAVCALKGWE